MYQGEALWSTPKGHLAQYPIPSSNFPLRSSREAGRQPPLPSTDCSSHNLSIVEVIISKTIFLSCTIRPRSKGQQARLCPSLFSLTANPSDPPAVEIVRSGMKICCRAFLHPSPERQTDILEPTCLQMHWKSWP